MPQTFHTRGNIELLSQNFVAVYGSRQAPTAVHDDAGSLARAMARAGMTVAGGWQSPLEKYFLRAFADCDTGYVIRYTARPLDSAVPKGAPEAMMDGRRLLQVAPDVLPERPTRKSVARRDALMLEQCHAILFLYIAPGGHLAELFDYLTGLRYPLFVLEHALNRPWMHQGALAVPADDVSPFS